MANPTFRKTLRFSAVALFALFAAFAYAFEDASIFEARSGEWMVSGDGGGCGEGRVCIEWGDRAQTGDALIPSGILCCAYPKAIGTNRFYGACAGDRPIT